MLVDLARQGGGSHGAFTWGVLDRLLEEPWLQIAAISGTSAGAMNAAVLADGWLEGGAEGAKNALEIYWGRVSHAAAFSPFQRSPFDRLMGRWPLDTSPAYVAMDLMSRFFSPAGSEPDRLSSLAQNSGRNHRFRTSRPLAYPIVRNATSTEPDAGALRNGAIPRDVLLASACLPTMFAAIEIDGEMYWDGGFAGNPTITPLVRESDAHDTILVQINPTERKEVPRTAAEILDRLNEISFKSPLAKELRMIALLRQVADPGTGEGARWAQMRTHVIWSDMLAKFGVSSKINAEWDFVSMLCIEGRRAASEFLVRERRPPRPPIHCGPSRALKKRRSRCGPGHDSFPLMRTGVKHAGLGPADRRTVLVCGS